MKANEELEVPSIHGRLLEITKSSISTRQLLSRWLRWGRTSHHVVRGSVASWEEESSLGWFGDFCNLVSGWSFNAGEGRKEKV